MREVGRKSESERERDKMKKEGYESEERGDKIYIQNTITLIKMVILSHE